MRTLLSLVLVALAGCGSNNTCDPVANTGCNNGQSCEMVQGGGAPMCVEPLVVRGRVFRIADSSAIAWARVVALDVDGSPVSSVALTANDGSYELAVPNTRDANGAIVAQNITLRVDAQGFHLFPAGIRPALPITTGGAVDTNGKLVISSALTSVGLNDWPAVQGSGRIAGTVDVPASRNGVLVVADNSSGYDGHSAIADTSGSYEIMNVFSTDWTVKAYAQGVNYLWGPVPGLAIGETRRGVDLHIDTGRPATQVNGSISLVSTVGCSGPMTSIILVVESTFDAGIVRGQQPPGLRAPPPPTPGNVTSNYWIDGVPDGHYVVLGAFENDCLVRDPGPTAGTEIQHITVTSGTVTTVPQFKVTSAVAITSPGANGPEMVSAAPVTLSWSAYPSASSYDVLVIDATGDWRLSTSTSSTSASFTGPLTSGMFYQFRVTAMDVQSQPISYSEDLKGVFFAP